MVIAPAVLEKIEVFFLLVLFAFPAYTDSIVIDGRVYTNVHIQDLGARYRIRFLSNGRTMFLDKASVKPGDIHFSEKTMSTVPGTVTSHKVSNEWLTIPGVKEHKKILPVPYVRQKPCMCGAACFEMASAYFGKRISQDDVLVLGRHDSIPGVTVRHVMNAADAVGMEVDKTLWWPAQTAFLEKMNMRRLIRAIAAGHPVMVGVRWEFGHNDTSRIKFLDHFILVIGYDLDKKEIIFHDPETTENGGGPSRRMSFDMFSKYRHASETKVLDLELKGFRYQPSNRLGGQLSTRLNK